MRYPPNYISTNNDFSAPRAKISYFIISVQVLQTGGFSAG